MIFERSICQFQQSYFPSVNYREVENFDEAKPCCKSCGYYRHETGIGLGWPIAPAEVHMRYCMHENMRNAYIAFCMAAANPEETPILDSEMAYYELDYTAINDKYICDLFDATAQKEDKQLYALIRAKNSPVLTS